MATSKGDKTRQNIEHAMLRVKHKRPLNKELKDRLKKDKLKYSTSAVALEAGIDPSSIHNNYSDLAEKIRNESGREVRTLVSKKSAEIKELKTKNKALRCVIKEKDEENAKLVSINLRQQKELNQLKAIQGNENVLPLGERKD